jgi:allantoinase
MSDTWALRSTVVYLDGTFQPATLVIAGEQIAAVLPHDAAVTGTVTDVGHLQLLPGLIDTHVHINEPGRTEWEGFASATQAAAAGGITTLIDMPLNSSPVTTTLLALDEKRAAANGQVWVDVGFHAGVIPGNAAHLPSLLAAGVCAVKAFLCSSGLDEFPGIGADELRTIMPVLAAAGVPLFVHAELVSGLPAEVLTHFAAQPRSYAAYLATRPPEWEVAALQLLIELCRATGCAVHVVHLATTDVSDLLATIAAERLPITFEACPHYLYFAAEDIADGHTLLKCAPPIRSAANRAGLQSWVRQRMFRTLGSDHSPAPPALKQLASGNFRTAWGGIAALQFLGLATHTLFADAWAQVLPMLTQQPAELVGLGQRKGKLAPGYDADVVVFDPHGQTVVDAATTFHRHPTTPYMGQTLRGQVHTTYLRGQAVYTAGAVWGPPHGQLLRRQSR